MAREKVVRLVQKTPEGEVILDVKEMLENVLQELEEGKEVANKAVVLLLDHREQNYRVVMWSAGMSRSQIVALLEYEKHFQIKKMQEG